MSTQAIEVRRPNESHEEYEARRKAEVNALLERSRLTIAAVENGGVSAVPVGKTEFNDPNFRARPEALERNPGLAKALFEDEEIVMPWEEPHFVSSLKGKDEAYVLPPTSADEEFIPTTTTDVILADHSEPAKSEAEVVANLIDQIKVLEAEYIERYNAEAAVEAVYKKRLQAFNDSNAELINTKKETTKNRLETEEKLKSALADWGELTEQKKFDEYLSVKKFETFEYDQAAATTWAETNYPAAINKITNYDLIDTYLKTSKDQVKQLDWVQEKKEYKANISKKFVQTSGEVESMEVL